MDEIKNEVRAQERIIGQMNNSLYFTIPADIVKMAGLKKGEGISVSFVDGAIVATPKKVSSTEESVRKANELIDQYMDAMKYLENK